MGMWTESFGCLGGQGVEEEGPSHFGGFVRDGVEYDFSCLELHTFAGVVKVEEGEGPSCPEGKWLGPDNTCEHPGGRIQ